MKSFTAVHYSLMALSVALVALGLWMLSTSLDGPMALNWAPILLTFTYLVLLPAAFLYPTKKMGEGAGQGEES